MGNESPFEFAPIYEIERELETFEAVKNVLPTLKEFGDAHPKNYPWYVGALRVLGKIRDSSDPLQLHFTMDYAGSSSDLSWEYVGEADKHGEACGVGVATATHPDGGTWSITGTFRQGVPYGIVTFGSES